MYEPKRNAHSTLEGFALQSAEKVSDIAEDDTLGYIRVRGKVARETLMEQFKALPSKPVIVTEHDGLFEWTKQSLHEMDVTAEFSKCDNILADFRASAHGMWPTTPERVFGTERLSLTSVGER